MYRQLFYVHLLHIWIKKENIDLGNRSRAHKHLDLFIPQIY